MEIGGCVTGFRGDKRPWVYMMPAVAAALLATDAVKSSTMNSLSG